LDTHQAFGPKDQLGVFVSAEQRIVVFDEENHAFHVLAP
jgi:hypothetical protein